MTAIDAFLPAPRLRQVDRVAVAAEPDVAWRTVRGLDLYSLRLPRFLFWLRTLPDRLAGRPAQVSHGRLDDVISRVPAAGFIRLAEVEGHEFVAGAIGQFWKTTIPFRHISPPTFRRFDAPGNGKVAWSIRVDPRHGGGSWITVEVRVTATDEDSWRRFRPYWRRIGPFSHLIRRVLLRRFVRALGRARRPRREALAGDAIIPQPGFTRTHEKILEAPPANVWPWLVQMGRRRAGWYSIDRLDNGGTPSAHRIVPDLQQIAVGDVLPVTAEGEEGFAVLAIDRGRALVLGSPQLLPSGVPAERPPYKVTWAFVLEPIGEDATRLLVRVRASYPRSVRTSALRVWVGALHEMMERAQLRGIARRVAA